MKRLLAASTLVASADQAAAFTLGDCGPEFTPLTIIEPWEENSRTFANGAIRIFEIFVDPNVASGAALGILHPEPAEDGFSVRRCTAVYDSGASRFFAQAFVADATATYDPAQGLIITVPIARADHVGPIEVTFVVNQATGSVTLR